MFQCDKCGRTFTTKSGMSRHKCHEDKPSQEDSVLSALNGIQRAILALTERLAVVEGRVAEISAGGEDESRRRMEEENNKRKHVANMLRSDIERIMNAPKVKVRWGAMPDGEPETVGMFGHVWVFPPGEEVEVPEPVANLLVQSRVEREQAAAWAESRKLKNIASRGVMEQEQFVATYHPNRGGIT